MAETFSIHTRHIVGQVEMHLMPESTALCLNCITINSNISHPQVPFLGVQQTPMTRLGYQDVEMNSTPRLHAS